MTNTSDVCFVRVSDSLLSLLKYRSDSSGYHRWMTRLQQIKKMFLYTFTSIVKNKLNYNCVEQNENSSSPKLNSNVY